MESLLAVARQQLGDKLGGQLDHHDVAIHLGIVVAARRWVEAIAAIVADHPVIIVIPAIIADRIAPAVFITFIIGALFVAALAPLVIAIGLPARSAPALLGMARRAVLRVCKSRGRGCGKSGGGGL